MGSTSLSFAAAIRSTSPLYFLMNNYLGEPIMTSEYYPVFLFIYLKIILAWSFFRIQDFLMNISIPLLAQSFLRAQGLGSAESGIVLLYSEHFGLSRIRRAREKESPKRKTNPMVCYPNPILSPIMRILYVCEYLFVKNKPNGMLYIN